MGQVNFRYHPDTSCLNHLTTFTGIPFKNPSIFSTTPFTRVSRASRLAQAIWGVIKSLLHHLDSSFDLWKTDIAPGSLSYIECLDGQYQIVQTGLIMK
ncbi:MAG TPA: hypothetical protein DER33_08575 [Syntrophomonas sp.]|nr:hypothetical protein [Syntrophomonas sp.]